MNVYVDERSQISLPQTTDPMGIKNYENKLDKSSAFCHILVHGHILLGGICCNIHIHVPADFFRDENLINIFCWCVVAQAGRIHAISEMLLWTIEYLKCFRRGNLEIIIYIAYM